MPPLLHLMSLEVSRSQASSTSSFLELDRPLRLFEMMTFIANYSISSSRAPKLETHPGKVTLQAHAARNAEAAHSLWRQDRG